MMMSMIITVMGIAVMGIAVMGIAVMRVRLTRFTIGSDIRLTRFAVGSDVGFTRFTIGTNRRIPMITVAPMSNGWMMIQPDHECDQGKHTGRKDCTRGANARLLPAFAHVISEEEYQHERTERKQDR